MGFGLKSMVLAVVMIGMALGLTACGKHAATSDPYSTSSYGTAPTPSY